MKNFYLITLAIVLFSCNSESPEKQSVNNKTQKIKKKQNTSVYINKLNTFYKKDDYYVSLYQRGEHNSKAWNELTTKNTKVVEQTDFTSRIKLDDKLAVKYLAVDNMGKLVVIDSNQEIIDTLIRKNYELFETEIESSLIATYSGKSGYKNMVVISLEALDMFNLKKSSEFKQNNDYIKKTASKLKINTDNIIGGELANIGSDKISYLGYNDMQKNDTKVYLLKNGKIIKTLKQEFLINHLKPVSLIVGKEIFYVASAGVPNTDNLWNQLLSINFETMKLKFYDKNRYKKSSSPTL